MEYLPLDKIPHFSECEPLVRGMGYVLVDLKIIPQKTTVKISAVIACKDAGASLGVDECSKVHRALLPRLQALLGTDQTHVARNRPQHKERRRVRAFFAARNSRLGQKYFGLDFWKNPAFGRKFRHAGSGRAGKGFSLRGHREGEILRLN